MTIDEAIQQARYVADEHSDCWRNCENYDKCCKECEYENEQLAEWLEELKVFREISKKNPFIIDMIKHDKIVRNKAIDDFVCYMCNEFDSEYAAIEEHSGEYVAKRVHSIAEQLKAGGENDER